MGNHKRYKGTRTYCKYVAILLTAFASTYVAAQQTPLALNISSPQSKYDLNSSVSLSCLLTNVSEQAVSIRRAPDFGGSAGFQISVFDTVTGRELPKTFLLDALPPPPHSKADFVILDPSYVYGLIADLSMKELNISSPGNYRIHLRYKGIIFSVKGQKRVANIAINSNDIQISVMSFNRR